MKQTGVASRLSLGTLVPVVPVGAQPGFAQTVGAARPRKARLAHRHPSLQLCCGMAASLALATRSPGNWSANTDPQLQEAASPQGLRSGQLQRYRA